MVQPSTHILSPRCRGRKYAVEVGQGLTIAAMNGSGTYYRFFATVWNLLRSMAAGPGFVDRANCLPGASFAKCPATSPTLPSLSIHAAIRSFSACLRATS